ncbi:uncharacterized protein LY89DRAFT_727595 [Mollisia scopiformis]|uniref:Uncharacterized protein n=1 Tax=Mollisia scopiformis TaxID=149040 RepID=A0A194XWG6_MOLSC|nr:uncharacterized protein LY89DRAFT_727595 [Mollisia scopiformis]KUJ24573.1 hypothetical protein LY89DRAFT_727595 [Mollisia scopiformis]
MEVDNDDDVLQTLAEGKSMDYEQWPALLPRLLTRLEKIVKDDFPPPSAPSSQPIPSSPPAQSTTGDPSSQDSTQSTNKENAPPNTISTLPPEIQTLLKSITSTLNSIFSKNPPHTIQRFAELLLYPKQHYRTLASYLHALDRVVHVTSGAHIFPLPPAIPDPSSLSLLSNGTAGVDPLSISWSNPASTPAASTLGSDESLGGALLTPITWLNRNGAGTHSPMEGEVKTESTEMIEGPNGPGGIETVSVSVNGISSTTASDPDLAGLRAEGGITQGELLRQEQRAGVVPAAQLHGTRGDTDGHGEDDEMPHARGPEEMTMEDMGPQRDGSGTERSGPGVGMQGIDIEAAVGRKLEVQKEDDEDSEEGESKGKEVEPPTTPKREAEDELAGEGKRLKSASEPEPDSEPKEEEKEDQEMETVDADGDPKISEECVEEI